MAISTLKLVGELLESKTGEKVEVNREALAHLINDSCAEYEQLVNELKKVKNIENSPTININIKASSNITSEEIASKFIKSIKNLSI